MYRVRPVQNKLCENHYRKFSNSIHHERLLKMNPIVDDHNQINTRRCSYHDSKFERYRN